jgi:hypothetical protein
MVSVCSLSVFEATFLVLSKAVMIEVPACDEGGNASEASVAIYLLTDCALGVVYELAFSLFENPETSRDLIGECMCYLMFFLNMSIGWLLLFW